MSSKHAAVSTAEAPAPLPQFSQAIKYNGVLYCSGSIGIDPGSMKIVGGTTKDRAHQALRNMQKVIEAAGSGMDRVLKANIYLTDMASFVSVNEAWDEFFVTLPRPARTCVAVHQLPFGTDVEIEAIAVDSLAPTSKI